MWICRTAALVLTLLIVVPLAHPQAAQTAVPARQSPAVATPGGASYPDNAEGLSQFLGELVATIQNSDAAEIHRRAQTLILPEYRAWFARIFGADAGGRMAVLYEESLSDFESRVVDQVKQPIAAGRAKSRVSRFESSTLGPDDRSAAALVKAMQNPIPIYLVDWLGDNQASSRMAGFFFYVQDAFRYVGPTAFRGMPGVLPSRIRVRGNIMAASIIHQVAPVYPRKARENHIQGTIVLHAIIDYDGSIGDLQAIQGDPLLIRAALDAVKQWRYKPTLLNGEPVQVDTTISVVFTLGR